VCSVYAAPLADGSRAVVLFNAHTYASQFNATAIDVQFAWLGYKNTTSATVRDLYGRADLGVFVGSYTGMTPLHGVLALRITPTSPTERDTTWRPWFTGALS
jgi:alpha-galactosidase